MSALSAPPSTLPQPPSKPAKVGKRYVVPKINAESYPTFTQAVLAFLRAEHAMGWSSSPPQDLGWRALKELWGITPSHFDATILSFLQRKSPAVQQHLLLAFCTTNLTNVKNLSAFLSFTLHQLREGPPVCLFYLAGCCPNCGSCEFQHPGPTPGWMTLYKRWSVTLQDFDYLVLNAVFQHSPAEQDLIMYRLARMKLKSIKNLSALLFSLIQQLEQQGPSKTTQRKAGAQRRQQQQSEDSEGLNACAGSQTTTPGSTDGSVGSESEGLSSDEAPADACDLDGPRVDPPGQDVAPMDEYWQRMHTLQRQLWVLLQDAAEAGLDVDLDLVREAAPTLGLPLP
eukprot:GGOE01021690.1.p1 GENE.GGOE01021690.1~~GGOE01021690.1.p1  ORF type:complete len:355 (-),score=83.68 GGOE01021690.1:1160-2182(-)